MSMLLHCGHDIGLKPEVRLSAQANAGRRDYRVRRRAIAVDLERRELAAKEQKAVVVLDMRPLHERYSDDGVRYPDALPDDPDFPRGRRAAERRRHEARRCC